MKHRSRGAMRVPVIGITLLFALAACSSGTGSSPSATTAGSAPAASDAPSATPAPAKLKVGISDAIFAFSPLYVAKEKGFWSEQNLDVELSFFNSGTESQQALLGDAIDLGAGGYTEPMTVSAQGTPTVIFGATQSGLPYKLMTQKDITEVSQLEGKTLGVSKVGALSDQITRIALSKAGIDLSKIKIQQAGGSSSRLAALEAKAIDGTILSSPDDQLAIKAGFNTLIDVGKELPGFAYEVLYAKQATIDANHEVFLRFMKGLIKGAQYVTDKANKDEVLQITSTTINKKVEDLTLSYDDTLDDFPPTSEASLDGIKQALDGTKEFADLVGVDKLTPEDLFYADLQQEAVTALGLK